MKSWIPVEKLETLKDSEILLTVYWWRRHRLPLTSFMIWRLLSAGHGGGFSNDPLEQAHGYYLSKAAYERLHIERNPAMRLWLWRVPARTFITIFCRRSPLMKKMRPFVETAAVAIRDFRCIRAGYQRGRDSKCF